MNKPLFLLSKSKALEKFNEINNICDTVSYSLKTNFETGKILEENTNCFFSIHTINSLKKIKNPSKTWFFLQANPITELKEIFNLGANSFVADNKKDLDNLLDFAEKNNKKINLLLRMRVKEFTIHTGKYFVFGFYSHQINELVPLLKKNKNILKLGIHFHRKTQNINEWSLKEEIEDSIKPENLKQLNYVNIGGGLPAVYKNFESKVFNHIFSKIKELKNWLNINNIKLIIEPGRFITAPAIKLETEIINIYDNNIIINCAVYNAFMDVFIANIRLLIENELEKGDSYVIKGNTPDSLDIFRYSAFLKNPKIGDKIIFLNAGAYNFHSDFCELEKIKTKVIE